MLRRQRSWLVLVILLLAGAVAGGIIGDLLVPVFPVFDRSFTIGLEPPLQADIDLLSLTLGVVLRLNLGSALGLLGVILLYRRL